MINDDLEEQENELRYNASLLHRDVKRKTLYYF